MCKELEYPANSGRITYENLAKSLIEEEQSEQEENEELFGTLDQHDDQENQEQSDGANQIKEDKT